MMEAGFALSLQVKGHLSTIYQLKQSLNCDGELNGGLELYLLSQSI